MLRFDLESLILIEKNLTIQREIKNIDKFIKKIANFQKYLRSKLK